MRIDRTDRSRLADWWFTVDRVQLAAILVLMVVGLMLSLAASPAVAMKKGLSTFYFFERHVVFAITGLGVLIGLSFLSPRGVRRFCVLVGAVALASMAWALYAGPDINGARRWLVLAGQSLQPSEFAKPALIVLLAWLFAEAQRRPDMPALSLAVLTGVVFASLLVAQPDIGQALLFVLVWGGLYALSGQPLLGAAALAGLAIAGLVASYFTLSHVRLRIDAFLSPSPVENSQLDRAMRSFIEGGFFGRGPGEGTIKTRFPDAHTDFIYAVIAEEYGVIACLAVLILFAFIVLRALVAALGERDAANRLGIQGLALVFGLQALINMGVNVGLLPAKGMTLPYISAGGSSMLAISATLGMLLALMRRRIDPARPRKPRLMPAVSGLPMGRGAAGTARETVEAGQSRAATQSLVL